MSLERHRYDLCMVVERQRRHELRCGTWRISGSMFVTRENHQGAASAIRKRAIRGCVSSRRIETHDG